MVNQMIGKTPLVEVVAKARSLKLRWQPFAVIWSITLLLIASLWLLHSNQVSTLKTNHENTTQAQFFDLTALMEEHALRTFRAADQTLLFMIDRYQVEGPRLNLKKMMDAGVIDGSLFPQIGIIDAHGIYRFSNLPITQRIDLSDREHFRVHREHSMEGLYISKPVLGRASGEWSIQLTRRINDTDGRFAGVGVVSIRTRYFSKFYEELKSSNELLTSMLGMDGVFRVRQIGKSANFTEQIANGSSLELELRKNLASANFVNLFGQDGVERFYTYKRIRGYPILVMIGISAQAMQASFRPSKNILRHLAYSLTVLLLLLAIVLTVYIFSLKKSLRLRTSLTMRLRAGEERLTLALRGGSLGGWDWNLRDQTFTSNDLFSELLGYPAGDFVYTKDFFRQMLHPDDASRFFHFLHQHLKGYLEHLKIEARFRHKDGHWEWINLMSKVMSRSPAGRAERLSGTTQNVTEKVHALQRLAASEARWNRAISGSNEGIWDLNLKSDALYVSSRLLSLLNYRVSKRSHILRRWRLMFHPADHAVFFEKLQNHLTGESPHLHCECRIRCANGDYKWLLLRGCVERDVDSHNIRIAGSANDVTAERYAYQMANERTAQLDTILETSHDAFITFDTSRRIKYVNPAFEHMTGIPNATIIAMHETRLTEIMNQSIKIGPGLPLLSSLRHHKLNTDKTERPVIKLDSPKSVTLQYNLLVPDDPSSSVSQILSLRNITHETIVDNMKSEFLSMAAHELRTPMASIMGYSEILLNMDIDPPQQLEFLGVIHSQSERMRDILDELLDLSRIEARRGLDFNFTHFNLKTLVEDIVESFRLPEGRSCPLIRMHDTYITADIKKIRQAILNTLSNAYKYSPPGTDVTIMETTHVDETNGPMVGLCTADKGIGMAPHEIKRVFERFYRADMSGQTPGTGLGMAIVKEIMDIHKGKIVIESQVGQGCKVSMLFPASTNLALF